MTYERRRTTHKEYPVHVLEPLSKLNLIPKMKVVSFFTLLILLVGSFPVMVFSCWVSSKFPILATENRFHIFLGIKAKNSSTL